MNSKAYREFLLRSIPRAKSVSGGREVLCRCFYCPDSKDITHAHFYISIPESKDEPSLYNCVKCHACGMVTNRTFLDWGIYDDTIAEDLVKHNKNINPNVKKQFTEDYTYRLSNKFISNDSISIQKLEYINKRLGTNLTMYDMERLKIVLNLKDLLSSNDIQTYTRDKNVIDQLDKNFLGFISSDNAFLNLRRVCDEGVLYKKIDKRYINYSIFNKKTTISNYYAIPNNVDLSQPERTKIHITEGPFDILSIYENLRHRENGIYIAIGGSNYYGTILNIISKYKIPYCEIHIYPDNDGPGSNSKMEFIRTKLNSISIPVIIHRNIMNGEKDFGVPLNRIQEVIL
jgi:hypothetical protein